MTILLDFSCVFDTVNLEILLEKFRRIASQWFKSYLADRQQYVSINNSMSPTVTVNSGVS